VSPADHISNAESILAESGNAFDRDTRALAIAEAQAHATIALASIAAITHATLIEIRSNLEALR